MNEPHDSDLEVDKVVHASGDEIEFGGVPAPGADFWKNARLVYPETKKKQITLRLDPDMLAWFQARGPGYQTRMNAVLRHYYEHARNSAEVK